MAHEAARVAVVGPLSGPRAAWGRLLVDAAAALPYARVSWNLFDDQGDAAFAAVRAKNVADDGGFAAVVGHFNSLGARAALPVYRSAGLPVLLPLATAPGLADGGSGLVMRLCPDDDAQSAEIVRACRERGLSRIAVAHDGGGYGRRLAARVLAAAGGHLRAEPARWPEAPQTPVVLCGVHHTVARMLARQASGAALVLVPDDCDIPEFATLTAGSSAEILVARLAGGPFTRVVAAFAALACALDKHPRLRGGPLLDAVRREAAEGFGSREYGWELAPVPPRPRGRGGARFDVAVVGGGVVGRAVAAEMAERGARVALLDTGLKSSASAVSGGLVRAYEPAQPQRRLAIRATQLLWARQALAARHGFRRTGSLVLLGPQHLAEAAAGVAELRAAGLRADLLSVDQLAGRWPGLATDGIHGAVWEPGAGYAIAPVMLAALLDRARRAGATVFDRRVRELTAGGVILDNGPPIHAGVVVVAAGCGSVEVLGDRWPPDRPPRTRPIRYAILDAGERRLPSITDMTSGIWGRPDGHRGFLVGRPVDEWQVPVQAGRDLTGAQVDWIRAGARQRLPFLATAEVLTTRFGTDLYLAEGPLLGVIPGTPPTVVAAGWSGGGFKTAVAAAEHSAAATFDLLCAAPAGNAGQLEPTWSL
jgi:glycine/D-amino acid oxidase-like deaminating enzyme